MKYNNIFDGGYGIAPQAVMRDYKLSIEAKTLYCYFKMLAGTTGKAWPKRDTVLNDLAIGKNRYYKHLNTLIDQGLIIVEKENGRSIFYVKNINIDDAAPIGFGPVPIHIMRDCNLSIEAKAIYCYFQSLAGTTGKAWPKRDTILRELGISKDRFYKHLKMLVDAGYIQIETENGHNIYLTVCDGLEEVCIDRCNEKAERKVEPDTHIFVAKGERQSESGIDTYFTVLDDITNLQNKYPKCYDALELIRKTLTDILRAKYVTVSGIVRAQSVIHDMVMNMDEEHIIAVLATIVNPKNRIKNKRAWIQACLLNSLFNMDEKQALSSRRFVEKFNASQSREMEQHEATPADPVDGKGKMQDEYVRSRNDEINKLNAKLSRAILLGNERGKERCLKDIQAIDMEISQHAESRLI